MAKPWNAWKHAPGPCRHLDRPCDDLPGDQGDADPGLPPGARDAGGWRPAADVLDTGRALVVQVALPGCDPDDISVETRGRELVVRGARRLDDGLCLRRYQTLELPRGSFIRRFPLPDDADTPQASAVLGHGLLTVTVPRRPTRIRRRRIPVDTPT
jgi:HSP20 family protein